jgi:hypothetical protein
MLCSLCFSATLTGFALTFAAVDAAFSSCVVGLDLDMMVLWYYSNIPLCKRRALALYPQRLAKQSAAVLLVLVVVDRKLVL